MDTTQGTLRIYTYARGVSYTRRVLVETHRQVTQDMARNLAAAHRADGEGMQVLGQSAYDYIWIADPAYL